MVVSYLQQEVIIIARLDFIRLCNNQKQYYYELQMHV
jgi:hypothetical protein